MFVAAGCTLDPAEREYMEALRGEETGMSRRSESYARIGDSRRSQDDRDAAQRTIREQSLCGPCLDPFRY
jgi:hypothetical protein